MKNVSKWQPTRIIVDKNNGSWEVDKLTVAACSQYVVNLQAPHYIRAIKSHAKGKLLDCGCGRVPYLNIYRDLVEHVECIDWDNSPHEIQYADKLSDLNKKLPYKKNSFDTVLLSDVLEHIYKPNLLMSEITRVLRVGGKLICFVPFIYWLHEDPYDYNRYTEYALSRMCEDNGLKIIELAAYGGGLDVAYDIILKLNRNRTKTIKFLTAAFQASQKTRLYKKGMVWGSKKLPLGYILIAQKI